MRWIVQAEGDAPGGDHRALAERLGQVLALKKFGTYTSHFGGEDVNGPIHVAAPKQADDDGEQAGDPEPGSDAGDEN